MAAVIEVHGLHQRYGDFEAVRGVDFDVAAGETVAFLGPNGAGKTTTVEVLEGFRAATAGTVRVLGEDPFTAGSPHRARIGIVLQDAGFFDELTPSELVDAWRRFYPRPRALAEVLELVGLTGRGDVRVRNLSGGEKRRLDVALGIVGRPELLFLDEPTTGFDPAARRATWDTIDNLVADGTTVFLTTHYLDEAQRLADRILVIAAGRIVATGTPDDIGGRATAAGTIRFRLPAGSHVTDLVLPPGTVANTDDSMVTIETHALTAVTAAVTGWAAARGLELEALSVSRPSLEDVYLDIVATHEHEAERAP